MKIIFKSKKKKISTEIGFKKLENNTNNIDNIPIIIENNDKSLRILNLLCQNMLLKTETIRKNRYK